MGLDSGGPWIQILIGILARYAKPAERSVFVVKICVNFNVLGIVLYSKFLRVALPHTPPGLKPCALDPG